MSQPSGVIERVGIRSPGAVLIPTVHEVAPHSRQMARRASPSSQRRAARAGSASGDFFFYEDSQGRQHFNFAQRIWLSPSVPMALTPVMTLELQTLAINLLTPLTRERDYRAAVGVTSKRVMRLADRFCAECLLTTDAAALLMPRSAIRAWLASRARL
jgi:hypothetical protein